MDTMKAMELFNRGPYSGRLRVHEANAEVVLEIGGARIPVTGVRWTSLPLAGHRQYPLTLRGDAAELAIVTQLNAESKAEPEAASESLMPLGPTPVGQDEELCPTDSGSAEDAEDADHVPAESLRQGVSPLRGWGAGNDRRNILSILIILSTQAVCPRDGLTCDQAGR